MNHDYNDFLNSYHKSPAHLDKKVMLAITKDLNPDHKLVFGKLILIHGFIGFITMLFCPQFNMSLTNNFEVFHYLHQTFGHEICMMICGSIFLGSGAIFASSILTKSEVEKIKSSALLYYTCLSILAVSIFMIFGADVYLKLVIFWLIGAVISSALLFSFTNTIKVKYFSFR